MIDLKISDIERGDNGIKIRMVLNHKPITMEIAKKEKKYEITLTNGKRVSCFDAQDFRHIDARVFAIKLEAVIDNGEKIKVKTRQAEKIIAELLPKLQEHSDVFEKKEKIKKEANEEIKKEANDLLNRKDILVFVKNALDKRIKGEDENKLLLFLICLSKEVEPQACLLVSESGAGKSYLLHQILDIFVEDVLWFSRVTPSALDRIGRDLTGKIFAIEEETGITPEAEAMIRAWISEGQLKLLTTIKDERGNIKTAEIETTGKPVFLSTTTRRKIDDERETRLWIISPDPSTEQTKLINLFSARREVEINPDLGDREIAILREALRILKEENKGAVVKIPFAEKLAEKFPSERVRARRDFKKLLALIKISAYLHSRNRPIINMGNEKIILATPGDLGIVWRLITKSIKPTLTGLTPSHEEVLRAIEELRKNGMEEFTIYDLKTHLNYQKSRLLNLVYELEAFGYVELVEEGGKGRGKRAIFKLSEYEDKTSLLPFTSNGSIDSLFTENELENWLNVYFHSSQVDDKEKIFSRFFMNYYDPIGEKILSSTSTQVECHYQVEEAKSYSEKTEKSFLPLEVNGSNEFFSEEIKASNRRPKNKVKIKIIQSDPFGKYNFGDEVEAPEEEAEILLLKGYAIRLGYKCVCGASFADSESFTKHASICDKFQMEQNQEVMRRMEEENERRGN